MLIIVMGLYILSRTVEGAFLGLWERLPRFEDGDAVHGL